MNHRQFYNHWQSSLTFKLCVAALFCLFALPRFALAEDPPSFNHDIRPILSENCFQCHGPDEGERQADLRLDTREGAIEDRGGSAAIVPGQPDASAVMERIVTDDEYLRMPPAETEKQLTADQIDLLRRWIAAGAAYQRHWAFEPVQRETPPPVEHKAWARNPIDRFIVAKLEEHGLSPSPPADRHTLIRRVYLDLLGLAPTVEEVDTFVNDPSEDAYDRLLDRVLASPRFGERWGRHWLDQARYADSHGYTNDNERVMWPYRDWVIDAFNRDLPFDQFTAHQLAGDLLPHPSHEQLIATGFHRNTLINTEGGTKADQFRDEQVKDRVDTTGDVWLGLTIGCAKCHTHKYDPISQAEYYEFYSFFNSTADRNSVSPTIKAPTDQQQRRLDQLAARIAELSAQLNNDPKRQKRQLAWEESLIEQADQADGEDDAQSSQSMWTVLELDGQSEHDANFESLNDHSLLVSGKNEANDEYKLTASSPLTEIRSVRLEAFTHNSLPRGGPGRAGNGNFVLSEIWFRTGDGRELRFNQAHADHSQKGYDISAAIDGNTKTGWAVNGSPEGGPNHNRTAWLVLPSPLEVEEGHALTFSLQFNNGSAAYNLGRLRLSISAEEWIDMPSTKELARLAHVPSQKRSKQQSQRLEEAFFNADAELGPIYRELQAAKKQRDELSRRVADAMVLRELDSPRQTHLQIRGDFLRPGEPVKANVPDALPPMAEVDRRRTRLDLADWLTQPDNPLTPRVRMNRIWMRLFGVGLVETENDFGTQGSLPTHPELLDWLASEFKRQFPQVGAQSTKRMLRLIANSATYRQSSKVTGKNSELAARVDPRNQLLWRQNRVRVEGEIVRDLALSVSGLLSDKIGGPSVHPPQPEGVYDFTQRKKNWRTSVGEDRYRRGIYTFFYRSAPYPMLTTFDAPKFNQTCTRRTRSNTPLQSLTVANDQAMFEMTRALAVRALRRMDETDDARLTHLFRLCFARPPQPAEGEFLSEFLSAQRKHFAAHPEAAKSVAPADLPESISTSDAAAWVASARVLLNLDEFITRE